MPRRRRGGLSDEDRQLWSQITARTTPLHGKPKTPPAPALKPAPPPVTVPAAPRPPLSPFRMGETAPAPRAVMALQPSPAERLAAAGLRMDHKTHRRMTRGKLSPEARIDLHGMTLAIAQPVLERFVLAQHAAGRRLVLVITGKGKAGGPDAPLPVRPGALRHYVPLWLHRPPLSGLILQVTPAHVRHGGEGAYYIYLRR